MKRLFAYTLILLVGFLAFQCGSNNQPAGEDKGDNKTANENKGDNKTSSDTNLSKPKNDTVVILAGINSKGVGRFNNIQLTHPLDEKMVANGHDIYETKCFACHKITTELLVGPGWYGVTKRRTPEWIMNWITNTKVMLDKDQAAQADMVLCLIRMPNQDLTDEQAREVLEFMRKNDGQN